MTIVDFYAGTAPTPHGLTLQHILQNWTAKDFHDCEEEHLQYLAPTPEQRTAMELGVIVDEEVFNTFHQSVELRDALWQVTKRGLELNGFEISLSGTRSRHTVVCFTSKKTTRNLPGVLYIQPTLLR